MYIKRNLSSSLVNKDHLSKFKEFWGELYTFMIDKIHSQCLPFLDFSLFGITSPIKTKKNKKNFLNMKKVLLIMLKSNGISMKPHFPAQIYQNLNLLCRSSALARVSENRLLFL